VNGLNVDEGMSTPFKMVENAHKIKKPLFSPIKG
jgi:hypothetical protein